MPELALDNERILTGHIVQSCREQPDNQFLSICPVKNRSIFQDILAYSRLSQWFELESGQS